MIQNDWKPEVQAVWGRLERFQLDDVNAVFDYSARLAKENGWTRGFTRRVVQEYKRFLLLAKFAGHPVTPSEAIDQAWHLHLVYTRSYWQELCGKILEQPLHHNPTAGGGDEEVKFRRQYEQTLASYRELFGEEAPAEIWPRVGEASGPKELRWVDASRHWLVPRPAWMRRIRWRRLAVLSAMLLAVAGLVSCNPNVLDWRGTDFLGFYMCLFIASLACGALLVALRRRRMGVREVPPLEDRYDIAFLAGGGARVLDAALAALYSLKLIWLNGRVGRRAELLAMESERAYELHEVEHRVWKALPRFETLPLMNLRKALVPEMMAIQERLAEAGLVMTDSAATRLRWLAAAPAIMVWMLGVAKLVLGVGRDKPVFFLALLLFATIFIIAIFFGRMNRRTPTGEAMWKQLKANRPARGATDDPAQIGLMVAIGGLAAVNFPGFEGLYETLKHRTTHSSSGCGASACGSGCGSGGDGGGGGCGGGGCGGCGGGGD